MKGIHDQFGVYLLRPRTLDEYIGQEKTVKTLKVFIKAVKNKGTPSEHILLYGPAGIGKTTLAHVIAKELRGDIKVTSGAAIQKTGDLAAILTNLNDNDVLFIDEIHRMPRAVEEMLYPVLEEYILDIVVGKGPSAHTLRLPVPHITIVGATTKLALLTGPLRDRFGLLLRLNYYREPEMIQIVLRSSKLLKLPIDKNAAKEIAKRSRWTPRIANRILKRAHDMFIVDKHVRIDDELLSKLFSLLELDKYGLTDIDHLYLRIIGKKYQNHPVGIETIASALSEDKKTIEEFIEPYLFQIGFVKKTPRGRVLTPLATGHLGLRNEAGQKELL
ncbi:Holliday junction branch migration DNA helicase RuvB [Candidatus Roizmanbacteria bacterium]|nr:Holliday junction branch migration DNA helicase RuvB [Candidatus Roizmanbacteria bacterium]